MEQYKVNYFGENLTINAPNLFYIFKTEFEFKFDIKAEKFSKKNARLLKILIDEQGAEESYNYIIKSISKWSLISKKFNINSYPTISILYGFRQNILYYLKSINKNKVEYANNTRNNSDTDNRRTNRNFLLSSD